VRTSLLRRQCTTVLRSAFVLTAAALMLASCGGGGGSSVAHVPSIADLAYTPSVIPAGAGSVVVTGAVSFYDEGGDIQTVTVRITDTQGNEVSSISMPILGAEGQTSGIIGGNFAAPTYIAGQYTIHLSIADSQGAYSNELDGLLTVGPAGNQAPVPAAAVPGTASQDWTLRNQ
jgi:hypothetical protein